MRNLEKRLEKLDQEYKPAKVVVFLVTDFGEGEVKGWKGDGFYIALARTKPIEKNQK